MTGCARVAANPERRTSAGVFSEAWHSHNRLTTFANVNDVVTCVVQDWKRIAAPTVNLFTGLVLTHGDSQHIGGVTQLLSDFRRVRVIDNPAPDRSLIHRRLSRIVSGLEGRGRKPDELGAGEIFHLSREAIAHVLFPPRGFAGATADDHALVIRLSITPSTFPFVHVG